MIVFVQLTLAGLNTGPFDLYSDVDGFSVPFATGVPKNVLEAGTNYTVDNTASQILVASQGVCTTQITLTIVTTTTTTTTTTSTTTTTTSSTTTTTTTAVPLSNRVMSVVVGVPDTTLDYVVQLYNSGGSPVTYRVRISNETQGPGVYHIGQQHILPAGTPNTNYGGTITAYPFANMNGDSINVQLSDDDGITWTAPIVFNPPDTLPYPL